MNRRNILSLTAIATLALAMVPDKGVAQQKSVKEQLVGTWAFVSSTSKLADGSPLWGTNPKGQLSFEASGRYSSIIVRSDLAKYASSNRMLTSPSEDKATQVTWSAGTALEAHVAPPLVEIQIALP